MFGGADPFVDAATANADALQKNSFAMLLINGDNDRPEAFATLAETMKTLRIPHEVVILKDTNHNLGLYYDRAGKRMAEFLGRQLKLGLTAPK